MCPPPTLGALNLGIEELFPFLLPLCGAGLVWQGLRLARGSEEYLARMAKVTGTDNPQTARVVGCLLVVAGIGMLAVGVWMFVPKRGI